MKRLYLWVFLCNTAQAVTGQGSLQFPFLGQPIERFKDSLICKDAGNEDRPYSKALNCRSYLVQSSATKVDYGPIRFYGVIVFPDSSGVIRSLSQYKTYLNDSSMSRPKDDFRALTNHFNNFFESKGSRSTEKSLYSVDEVCTWKKDGIRIVLRWTSFKRRKNVRVDAIFDLYIEEEKK